MSKPLKVTVRLAACFLLGVCPASLVSAQDGHIELGTITLNTDRAGGQVLDVPANVTVIDDDEIDDRHITDMEELVRNVPGVTAPRQTTGTDPFSTFGGFVIRGVGGNRVAMQVDGSRVPERIIDGTRDYLDFSFTKQAEIVRGPASVLWGADALGGLVALETLDPEDLLQGRDRALNMKGGFDSFDNGTDVSLTFGQRFTDDLSILVGIKRATANEPELTNARDDGGIYGCFRNIGFGATTCGEFDPMSTESTRTLAKLVWTPGENHRFEFSADITGRETDVRQLSTLGPVTSTITGAPTGEVINQKDRFLDLYRERYAIEHSFTPGGVMRELRTTFAYTPNGYTRTGFEASTSASGDSIVTRDFLGYSEDFYELDVQATFDFMLGQTEHELIMGFDGDIARTDYERRDIETNLTTGAVTDTRAGGFNFANATTTRADIYVQDQVTFAGGAFELTPGLRFATYKIDPRPDANYMPVPGKEPRKREQERLLASLGAIYRFDDTWSVWGKYGEGFKMPTAQQLYTSLPGAFFNLIPAPNLRPEEVKSYELGLRFEKPLGFFAINGFYAQYDDFIQSFYNPPGTSDYTYRNISKVDIWGIEASGAWQFTDRTGVDVSAAWQKGRQKVSPTAVETPHTLPPLTATVALTHEIPSRNLTLEGVATFAADVQETESPTDFKPDGYALLDLYAKWEVVDNGFIKFGVQNVFDKRYFVPNAATYGMTASTSVANTNPIELQTGPGRTFMVSFDKTF
ncbi:TonB-dependent hemoglobin/transferrin/lactoferrin family receptor [Roseovarius sp.]|uniref:TonB-dependent hemoglobin/transferrin/lactoferrin family receptor n=1 Tax=Roseovarius sp. TaxID=1486281 RepID=UPI00262C17E3|nr:TonB-dependent hemoglobin/transferrin/lactoferrin family receptor [Roseovarius sp.]MDM8165815.1 TonB-dependent hemoglobin/transferrin/lactoferrin family receptor [Roseovarius sp.]